MSAIQVLGVNAVVILVYMTGLWLASLALKKASLVDSFWGLGFVVSATVYFILSDGLLARKVLLLVLVGVWGLRLSFYIFVRNYGKLEDPRYQAMRERRGAAFWWVSYFQVFLFQGVLMLIISVCLLAAQHGFRGETLMAWDFAGLVLWIVGFFFESVGDWQLARFKRDPQNRGKVMDRGLWRYTRHPNYFGEVTMWWGYYLIAVAAGGWWSFFSPLLMTLLILRVSGVTLLEKRQVQTKPGYAEYVARTSAFVPWFPKKGKVAQSGHSAAAGDKGSSS